MASENGKESKAERRQRKKTRRGFKLHGSSFRAIYQNVTRRRLKERK
ncbi:MAG TPA: hypothetical protein G4O12_01525 [Dehalococcoidia bacterium]|nr:hypothetical protein [Dehalococcoidia bacterium]